MKHKVQEKLHQIVNAIGICEGLFTNFLELPPFIKPSIGTSLSVRQTIK